MQKRRGNYTSNVALLKEQLREWLKSFDPKIPQNRTSIAEWIQLFDAMGESEFAAELRAAIGEAN